MEIDTTYENVQVSEFTVKREGKKYSAYFEFTSTQGSVKVKLGGIRDTDNLCELLEADRLWVEEETDSQVEFGRYTLGISHDDYSTVVFDVLS